MFQLNSINNYDDLLEELSEKNHSMFSSSWSVEVRISFLFLTNIILFVSMKYFSNSILSPATVPILQKGVAELLTGKLKIDENVSDPMEAKPNINGFDISGLVQMATGLFNKKPAQNIQKTPLWEE
jgi:hypothetical protein